MLWFQVVYQVDPQNAHDHAKVAPYWSHASKKTKNAAIFSEVKRIGTAKIFTKPFFVKQKGHIYHDYIMHISHRIHVWYIYPPLANVNGKCFPTITIHGGIFGDNSWDFYLLEDFEKNKWCWVLLDSSSMIPLIFAANLSWCFSYPGPTVLVDLDSKV